MFCYGGTLKTPRKNFEQIERRINISRAWIMKGMNISDMKILFQKHQQREQFPSFAHSLSAYVSFNVCMSCMSQKTKQAKKNFVCLPVCLPVCLSGCTWTFAVDTITFEGVSGSKQTLVGIFYVWNVDLVLKFKVKSWSWSWSWTEFWFSQKLCGATPNLVGISII